MNFLRCLSRSIKDTSRLFSTLTHNSPRFLPCQGASIINLQKNSLLTPKLLTLIPACGLKVKGKMRLRCKDCYYIRREGRLYVMCKTFPRHKQTHLVTREKYTWILTHAMQSKLRPY